MSTALSEASRQRDHAHMTYRRLLQLSSLLLIVVNLSLRLFDKLNFIVGP